MEECAAGVSFDSEIDRRLAEDRHAISFGFATFYQGWQILVGQRLPPVAHWIRSSTQAATILKVMVRCA